jgi:hypothetical protein
MIKPTSSYGIKENLSHHHKSLPLEPRTLNQQIQLTPSFPFLSDPFLGIFAKL